MRRSFFFGAMSAIGTKRTWGIALRMSAFGCQLNRCGHLWLKEHFVRGGV